MSSSLHYTTTHMGIKKKKMKKNTATLMKKNTATPSDKSKRGRRSCRSEVYQIDLKNNDERDRID